MRLAQLRLGELAALAGAGLVIASTFVRSYEGAFGTLDDWQSFGPAVALLLAAAFAALAMVAAAVTERTTALPVSAAVWCFVLGIAGVVAAIVRLLERPQHASGLCAGGWLALAGALLILGGAFQALRDERTSLYRPARPQPRPRP